MLKYLPFVNRFKAYNRSDFKSDIIGGLTVGVVLIPQGMAYAMLAGLPPVYGLYASLLPLVVYAFLGTSNQLAVGPVALDSLLVAAGIGALSVSGVENYISLTICLAFMVGVFQLLFGFFRMGFLVNFLSKPVISGFTSAAAIVIIFSQLKNLLGITMSNSFKIHELLKNIVEKVPEFNPYALIIGLVGILVLIVFKKINSRIPSILLLVVIGIAACYFFRFDNLGVEVVGEIPAGLPDFTVPNINAETVFNVWPIALAIALIGYLEAISIGKALEEKTGLETVDSNQELVALGFSNVLGSFFQSFPVTGGFSRSAINYQAGTKTNFGALFSVLLIVLTLLFFTKLFYFLPNAVLASIIMVSVFSLIDMSYAKNLWDNRRDEFVVLLITFLGTLFLGIKEGIFIGMLSSLLLMVYRTSNPHFAVLGNIKNSDYYKNIQRFSDEIEVRDDLLIVRFDAQLYFGNATFFKSQLLNHIKRKGQVLKGVILNAEAINYIDSTAAEMLTKTIREVHDLGLQFYIAGAIGPTRDVIFSSGIINELHREYLFVKTKEAVAFFDDPKAVSEVSSRVAYENRCKIINE
jgi:SulP family sulfate permease